MECFRVDESGYTGHDLLNNDQRFQGAAAISISNEDASRLIYEHFRNIQAPELKYASLSRRRSNYPKIIQLHRDLLKDNKCVTYVCDKRYLLILMFLDHAVEPFYQKRGFDFYEHGQNFAAGSLLSRAGPTLLGEDAFNALLVAFQAAIKQKTPEALSKLVDAARRTRWKEIPELLGPLAKYAAPECLKEIAAPGVDTDAALVVVHSLISRMEIMVDGPYRVEHDESKNLRRYHELLKRLINHEETINFRQTEITNLAFPFKLADVTQVNSKGSPAVQLADVLIGAAIDATNHLAGLRSDGLDPAKLLSLYRDDQIIHLFPSIDFEEQRRFREGAQAKEMIEYYTKHFSGSVQKR